MWTRRRQKSKVNKLEGGVCHATDGVQSGGSEDMAQAVQKRKSLWLHCNQRHH